jgi:hypothetical protein
MGGSIMAINLVSYGIENTAFLVVDAGQAPRGSPDSLPTLTIVGGKPVSAALEIQSTLGGLLIPRMTTTQRNALNVVNGFMIYNKSTDTFDIYQAGSWSSISDAALDTSAQFILATANVLFTNAQSIGALTTGLLKNTVSLSTGTLSTAVAGTDYYSPGNPTTILDDHTRHNLFVGTSCGNSSESGNQCVGLGINTLTGLTSAVSNVGIGYQAGVFIHAASNNVLLGTQTGNQNVTSTSADHVFIGYQSGKLAGSSALFSVGIGYQTFVSSTFPNSCVAIGWSAGALQTNYQLCTFAGTDADASASSLTHTTAIGNGASVAISTALVLGNGSINVGIGTSSPAEYLHVSGGNILIDPAGNNGIGLKLYNAGNTNYSQLISAAVASNITWTLPIADAAFALHSDGSGTLNFQTPTLGTITGLAAFSGEIANYGSNYAAGNASQSTTTVTGSGTTFTTAMVGGLIVFSNGSYGFITAFGSTTSLTVDTSQTVTLQSYIIYYNGLISDNLGNAGANNLYFSGNGIASYVPAPLNYYETVTLTASWTGPRTVTNQTIYLTRIGNVVTMRISVVDNIAANATAPWVFGSVIPARFIPANPIGDLYMVYNSVSTGFNRLSIMTINFVTGPVGTITAYTGNTGLASFQSGDNPIKIDEYGISWTLG